MAKPTGLDPVFSQFDSEWGHQRTDGRSVYSLA